MKTTPPRTTPALLLIGAGLGLLSVCAFAAESEKIVLNPFVVSIDANRGYYATETLTRADLRWS